MATNFDSRLTISGDQAHKEVLWELFSGVGADGDPAPVVFDKVRPLVATRRHLDEDDEAP